MDTTNTEIRRMNLLTLICEYHDAIDRAHLLETEFRRRLAPDIAATLKEQAELQGKQHLQLINTGKTANA